MIIDINKIAKALVYGYNYDFMTGITYMSSSQDAKEANTKKVLINIFSNIKIENYYSIIEEVGKLLEKAQVSDIDKNRVEDSLSKLKDVMIEANTLPLLYEDFVLNIKSLDIKRLALSIIHGHSINFKFGNEIGIRSYYEKDFEQRIRNRKFLLDVMRFNLSDKEIEKLLKYINTEQIYQKDIKEIDRIKNIFQLKLEAKDRKIDDLGISLSNLAKDMCKGIIWIGVDLTVEDLKNLLKFIDIELYFDNKFEFFVEECKKNLHKKIEFLEKEALRKELVEIKEKQKKLRNKPGRKVNESEVIEEWNIFSDWKNPSISFLKEEVAEFKINSDYIIKLTDTEQLANILLDGNYCATTVVGDELYVEFEKELSLDKRNSNRERTIKILKEVLSQDQINNLIDRLNKTYTFDEKEASLICSIVNMLGYFPKTNFNDLSEFFYNKAAALGWHEEKPDFASFCMNMHSEIDEMWEAYRENRLDKPCDKEEKMKALNLEILTAKEEEMADLQIRILDMAKAFGVDMDKAVKNKALFNDSRGYKHGGKKC